MTTFERIARAFYPQAAFNVWGPECYHDCNAWEAIPGGFCDVRMQDEYELVGKCDECGREVKTTVYGDKDFWEDQMEWELVK